MLSWLYVAATIVLTVYGQLVVKWQVGNAGELPAGVADKIVFLLRLATTPWVISVFVAAAIAALCWMAAMTRLELSRAYPFVGSSFALVLVLSAVFFGEQLNAWKIGGVLLIMCGLIVGSQA
jgi:multidrug transporter EmrE-like cation transporter